MELANPARTEFATSALRQAVISVSIFGVSAPIPIRFKRYGTDDRVMRLLRTRSNNNPFQKNHNKG
jgi:hypothetical protein